jgi:alpha-glucosidase
MALSLLRLLLFSAAVLGQLPRPAAQCPGYRATNILQGDSYLTADLILIGNCSSHGQDVANLRLLVEHQTGKAIDLWFPGVTDSFFFRQTPAYTF